MSNNLNVNKIKVYNKIVEKGSYPSDMKTNFDKSKTYITSAFKRSRKDISDLNRAALAPLYMKWVIQELDIEIPEDVTPLELIEGLELSRVRKDVADAMFGDADESIAYGNVDEFMAYLERNKFDYEILD